MFEVLYQPEAVAELEELRAFDRVRILGAVERQLMREPQRLGGQKKRIGLGDGDFVYQLRIGDFRLFYDIDERKRLVIVRHVRRKGRKTTGEIL